MNKEIIIIGVDKMGELRASIGQSEKKIKNSAQEFISMPLEGTFSHIGTKEFDIPEVGKRVSLGLYTANNEFVSENALTAQNLLAELAEIKSGTRKGKFSLKSVRLTDLNKFGASQDLKLVNLQGKHFKAVPVEDARVYKSEYLDSAKFDEVCANAKNEKTLKDAMAKTEIKKLYKFEIVE